MNLYTPDDVLTFPIVNGVRECPTGDYSAVKTFTNGPFKFGDSCVFSRCTEFLSTSEFGDNCVFADFCYFMKTCTFGRNCIFGRSTIFDREPAFNGQPRLGAKSRVAKSFF